jgi:hypothetical protein
MTPAELSAYCASPSILSVAGTVALMTIAAFVGRIFAIAFVGRIRGRIELPPSVAGMVVVAAGSVAVMLIVQLVNVLGALIAECPGTVAEQLVMALLFTAAALFGVTIAGHFGPQLFEEFESVPKPEPTRATTDPTVPATTIYAQLGDVLQTLARAHGYNVGRNEVYDLIPDRQLFRALPAADAEALILKLATEIVNAEAVRIGSPYRTTPAEIRSLTNGVAA